jgi:hypothetical protein
VEVARIFLWLVPEETGVPDVELTDTKNNFEHE